MNEEIGAKTRGPRGQVAAILALLGVIAVWGVRDYQHRKAVAALQARVYQGEDPIRASAFPYPLTPFTWYGVVETHDFFAQTQVDSLTPEVDPHDNMQIRYKPEETAASLAAKCSDSGRVYLDWAQVSAGGGRTSFATTERLFGTFPGLRFMYPESPSELARPLPCNWTRN